MKTSPRVLLTSVIRPFGGVGEGDSVGAELFHAQVTRAQGPFSLRQVIRVWALDYLAENLEAPAVTLHYPARRDLVRELKTGDYTHVGINFVVATFHKVREMVPIIRRYAPAAEIVLGGYGTVLPDEVLSPWADAICREEGVQFMRRLLGERADTPIRHPHAPVPTVQTLSYQRKAVVGHVTAGLGCTNACDFCCTSHFFRRKYVPFSRSGRDIYDSLIATRDRARADGLAMDSFVIIDEDFFLHHRRARDFLACVREGGEPLSLMGFGSVRGLSRFTGREIAEMGFELVWNAFEGVDAGYAKQKGRPLPELYEDLKSNGCGLLTSMIIGFPYQNEATIRAEFDQLMALEPSMTQCLIYFAFPGTPFHDEVVKQGRYLPQYESHPDLRRWDGFSMHFGHPHFDSPEAVEKLQRALYQEDFDRLGPTVLRVASVWLRGYKTLRDDSNPLLAKRAERLRERARGALPALSAAMAMARRRQVRERAAALHSEIVQATGDLSIAERAKDAVWPALYGASWLARKLGVLQQPGLLRTEHRSPGSQASLHTRHVVRLQGAHQTSLVASLAEDAWQHARDLLLPGNRRARALVPGLETLNQAPSEIPCSLPAMPTAAPRTPCAAACPSFS